MPEQTTTCPACEEELASDKYDVCFSKETCLEYCRHERGCYRYFLQATLPNSRGKGTCLFIMLNPSTADESKLDPTVTRCIKFAKEWKYETVWICNLYAFRSSAPNELRGQEMHVPLDKNGDHVRQTAQEAAKIILAWGDGGYQVGQELFLQRVKDTIAVLVSSGTAGKLHRLNGFTGRNQPRHPLGRGKNYLPLDTPCVRFTNEELENFMRHGVAPTNS